MKLIICTKFYVNRMNCVESRRGRVRLTPPSSVRVTSFSSWLLGLMMMLLTLLYFTELFRNGVRS